MTSASKSWGKRIVLIAAEIALALITVGLLFAIWLPIDSFRNWLSGHFSQ
jgi:hypothetical protein